MKGIVLNREKLASAIKEIDTIHSNHFLSLKTKEEHHDESFSNTLKNIFVHKNLAAISVDEIAEELKNLFLAYEIPFAICIEDLNSLQKHIRTNEPESTHNFVTEFFAKLQNKIGFHYIHHEARHFNLIEAGDIRTKPLYQIHAEWQNRLVHAILNDTLNDLPLFDSDSCPFSQAILYPESKMMCYRLDICDFLQQTHARLHELTTTFVYMYTRENFKAAYFLFQQIKETSEKLLNLVAVLYFNAQIDRPQTLRSYIYRLLHDDENIWVALFDIFSMQRINKFYPAKTGDKILKIVGSLLASLNRKYWTKAVLSRGTGGDFYLLFQNADKNILECFIEDFEERLSVIIKKENALPEFSVKKAFLELTPPLHIKEEEVSALFKYLKERLKEEDSPLFIMGEKEQKRVLSWLTLHYQYIARLSELLEEGALEIFLQPIRYLKHPDKVHAYEILARINETGTYVSAGAFIDLLVEAGMVHKLDHLVLERMIYHKNMLHSTGSMYFINVSAVTLRDKSYVEKLIDAIRGPFTGMEIIVELTEQVLLDNMGLIMELHDDFGLTFAIDDFGTGYSSLHTVIKLAEQGVIKYLKIDGSLTSTYESSASTRRILSIIANMGEALELYTIIEFVESEEQVRDLKKIGIDYGQGYHLGAPTNILEFYLKNRSYLAF
jgi:EAL domain-containing protein (putative c-di-GMP-specific phosphodiesterase class I)/GGDEF domain-containing protein